MFRDIIKPSLYDGIEYDLTNKFARRWYPNKQRRVVLDPSIEFGKPTVVGSGIPTAALFAHYLAEGSDAAATKKVAAIFDILNKDVSAAIQFEQSLRQQAA